MNSLDTRIISFYTVAPLKGSPSLFFLPSLIDNNTPVEPHFWNRFQGDAGEGSWNFLRFVSDPVHADFLLLPHKYSALKRMPKAHAEALLSHFVQLARAHGKRILIFALADSDARIDIPHSYIFRYSQYGYKKRDNEIMIPPYVFHARSSMLEEYRRRVWNEIIPRSKAAQPVVSFCGWAGFSKTTEWFKYGLALAFLDFQSRFLRQKYAALHKPGIYFRRKSLKSLANPKRIKTHFIARKSFSAQLGFDGNRVINPKMAEKDNIESIINADFVLSPKGNANESIRFYEALSLGRLPVLIDTDKVLPLEQHIEYDKFIVRVDYTDIENTEKKIIDFYRPLSDEEFKARQKMAQEAFELLRPASCLRIILSELKNKEGCYKD